MRLKEIVDSYMQQVPQVREHCQRCLATERWHGNVVLMVVDAAFTSIGLNYFQSVVPKVDKFRQKFVERGKIRTLDDLATSNNNELYYIWKNKRSWSMAKSVAAHLASVKRYKGLDDRQAFIYWAKHAQLDGWEKDPIGQINGVGINSFQYLRMMGGIDTVMPDKIVKRVIAEILTKANMEMSTTDIDFVRLMDRIAQDTGYKAIELCWMTWMIQSEAGMSRMKKYADLLPEI